jgi:UDP-N-acetylglucosamine 1-carboxyvinyltransferase
MSPLIVLATQAKGTTLLHDWMYESRMFFVDKLVNMGAKITICDPHRVLVTGPTLLRGKILDTPDIRAGMALILAALCAKGESVIHRVELVKRGYEDIVGRFRNLGAKIVEEEDEKA